METKVCSKCGKELPATTEYFIKNSRNKRGLASKCKECAKKWREENKERIKQWNKEYHAQNIERIKKKKAQYHIKNKKKICEKTKQWRKDNPEKYKQMNEMCGKKHYQENKDYYTRKRKEYAIKYPDRGKIKAERRRALMNKLPATLTAKQWTKTKKAFDNKCAYCGETHKLEQEHFIALSKGGGYTQNNIVTACRSCNSSKRDKDFFEWYPKQDFYSKERETAILEFLDLAKEEAI